MECGAAEQHAVKPQHTPYWLIFSLHHFQQLAHKDEYMPFRNRLRNVVNLTHLHAAAIRAFIAVVFLCVVRSTGAQTAASTSPPNTTQATAFVVESYYRIRWGSEEEFMALFRKNHMPFIRRQLEKGILLDVRLDAPREHMNEESRWDLRMTLVYRDAATAYRTDNITEADYNAIVKDDAAETIFKREERRRFELLIAHWDLNVKPVELAEAK
jgi:hypothetical protein